MKEMFLEKGFNDYISKPLEISKLDELMAKWVPKQKQIKTAQDFARKPSEDNSGIHIPGIDAARGISLTGGTVAGYREVLSVFYKDAEARLPNFAAIPSGETELASFAIHVHALKSASGSIGAEGLSKEAGELETAGKAGDMDTIKEKLFGFYENLKRTIAAIRAFLGEDEKSEDTGKEQVSIFDKGLRDLFLELKTAMEAKDSDALNRLMAELAGKELDQETEKTMNAISDLLFVSKFKRAIAMIDEVLKE
jgi:HPt (histidine-containing phosphotransfer) domain-containing protein